MPERVLMVDVGRRLRALREARGIPKEQLAINLGMSAENWRHYETGRNRIHGDLLPVVARSLGMSLAELVQALYEPDEAGANVGRTPAAAGLSYRRAAVA